MAIDAQTSYAYVVSDGNSTLSRVSPPPDYAVVNTTTLPGRPSDVAVSAAFDRVYVALPRNNTVAVLDRAGNLVGAINMGKRTKPTFLAMDEARGLLYVANHQEKRVAVVDMATNSLLSRFAAEVSADGFGFHPGLNRIFVSDQQTGTVRAFNPDTGAQLGQVTLSGQVTTLSVDVERNKIYAALPVSSSFAVLDAATLAVEAYLPTPSAPAAFAVDYTNDRLLVSYSDSSSVGIWNAVTLSELVRATVGPNPAGLAVYQDSSRALVTNSGSNTVSIIDTLTGSSPGRISTLDRPASILVSQATNRIYVGHYQIDPADPASLDAPLEIFSRSQGSAIGTVPGIGNVFPWGLAENPASSRLYVSRTYAGTVAVIDTSLNQVVAEIPVGGLPRALLFDPTSGYLFVSGMFTPNLVVINTATNSVTNQVRVGSESAGLALNASAGIVYVTVEGSGEVKALDVSTGTVVATGYVGGAPLGAAYSPASDRVYVANFTLSQLQVLDANTLAPVESVSFGWPVHTTRVGGGKVSVASWEGGANYVLNESTLQVIQEIPFWTPVDFALNTTDGYLYQTLFDSDTVERVAIP